DSLIDTASTVPRWRRQPGVPDAAERASRSLRLVLVMEEPVHDRTRAGDVGAERAELAQPVAQRRAGEVVRRQGGEVARTAHARERVEQRRAALLPTVGAVARVERVVDGAGRRLLRVARQDEHDEEVLRELERREDLAASGGEARTVVEEERNV